MTPRQLLASVSSEDIVEMMAFDRLEPMGALHQMYAFGQVCATLANVHRTKDRDPFRPWDFFPALAREVGVQSGSKAAPDKPVLLDDPEEQSRLLKNLFNRHSPSAGQHP